jgi:putative solute:sodium symporter small subunit
MRQTPWPGANPRCDDPDMRSADDLSPGFLPKDPAKPHRLGVVRIVLLCVWASASFGTCYFARELQWGPAGRPLAYAVAGQGLLILFIAIVLVNAAVFRHEGEDEEPSADETARGG